MMRFDGAVVALLRVPFGGDEPVPRLHPREAALLSPHATPHRRAEFAAGRAAARKALAALLDLSTAESEDLAILPEPGRGRPRPERDGGAPVRQTWCSITHASGLAAAVASRRPVGIDLVNREQIAPSFAKEAFCDGELEAWQDWAGKCEPDLVGAIAFAAKEATLKRLGTGMALPLLRVRVVPRARQASVSRSIRRTTLQVSVELRSTSGRRACHTGEAIAWQLQRHVMFAIT
jgi:4'-phosphopantetheinyl transferase